MAIIQKITEFTGIPSLAIEIAFLLLMTFIIVIIVFVLLAIFRIKTELI